MVRQRDLILGPEELQAGLIPACQSQPVSDEVTVQF
jgi:hypothetical protein